MSAEEARKVISELGYLSREDKLRELGGVVQLGEEEALGKPHCGLPVLKRDLYKPERDFSQECVRVRENGFKLKEGRFTLDVRKKFFMVRHWNRLRRKADVPFLEAN